MTARHRHFTLRSNPDATSSWRRFVRRFESTARPPDGVREYAGATDLWIPEHPKAILYFTKDAKFQWWFQAFGGDVPSSIAVIAHGSIPTRASARLVHSVANQLRVPVVLWGDLDPGDLTAFAVLAAGDLQLKQTASPRQPMLYGGLDDELLALVRHRIGARRFERECLVPMSAEEREHLAIIRKLCPPLEALCGRESARLLDAGYKCEVEAVTGPYLCRGKLLDHVLEYLSAQLPRRLGLF